MEIGNACIGVTTTNEATVATELKELGSRIRDLIEMIRPVDGYICGIRDEKPPNYPEPARVVEEIILYKHYIIDLTETVRNIRMELLG